MASISIRFLVQPDRINGLPPELVITVFEFFDVHTLLTCTSVCKSWFELGTNPYFSKRLRYEDIVTERKSTQAKNRAADAFFRISHCTHCRGPQRAYIMMHYYGNYVQSC